MNVATPLPPLKPSQTGKQWPRNTAIAAMNIALAGPEIPGDQHRGNALGRVEDQRQRRQLAPAGAQHIGGADIARADLADIAEPGGARDQQAERDRAEQIADDRRERRSPIIWPPSATQHGGRPSGPQRRSASPRPAAGRPRTPCCASARRRSFSATTHGIVGIEQDEVGRRADGEPAATAGRGFPPAAASSPAAPSSAARRPNAPAAAPRPAAFRARSRLPRPRRRAAA